MTHRVGPKGQVVIPKELRDLLGLRPGAYVDFDREGEHVIVRRVRRASELVGLLAEGPSLTDALVEERRADREREDRVR